MNNYVESGVLIINGVTYSLEFFDDLYDVSENGDCFAMCDYYHRQLKFYTKMSDEHLSTEVLHEVTHAILRENGLCTFIDMENTTEESFVLAFAAALNGFLKQDFMYHDEDTYKCDFDMFKTFYKYKKFDIFIEPHFKDFFNGIFLDSLWDVLTQGFINVD